MVRALWIILVAALLAVPLAGWWLAQLPLPPMEGVAHLPELSDPASVRFDVRAVPYIEAGSERDLYLSQGYVTARDRMVQMDLLRRTAQGKLAQVFGPVALPSDKLMRTIGFNRLAEAEAASLSPPAREALDAYARGVNLYILEYHQKLPLEFRLLGYLPEPWRAADSLAILKYLAYVQDESWKLDDLRQRILAKAGDGAFSSLFRESWKQTPTLVGELPRTELWSLSAAEHWRGARGAFAATPRWGSSAWAVAGRNSDTGGSLLACEKHTAFSAPDPWYLVSLSSPSLHAAGATIPGVPGIVCGRNEDMAWASAGLRADVQDLFLEEFSPTLSLTYRTETGWQDASEVTETIPVRFARDIVHKVTITRHGPVLLKSGTKGVALAWSGMRGGRCELEALFKLNRATGWADFRDALNDFGGSPQLFLYADRQGNTGFQAAGNIPVRAENGQGTVVVPGWLKAGQWTAMLPFASLPSALNPEDGAPVAANQDIAGPSYRHLIGHQWCPPYRAYRADSLLRGLKATGRKPGLPDMNAMQGDQFSHLSGLVRKELRDSIERAELIDRIQLAAMDVLEHWDGNLSPASAGATIYEAFLKTLALRLSSAKLGPELAVEYLERWPMWPLFVEEVLTAKPANWLPSEERTFGTFMLTTFSQALKDLRREFRNEDVATWRWQQVHQALFEHVVCRSLAWLGPMLNTGPLGVGGDQDALYSCAASYTSSSPGRFPSRSGPTMRLLVDMSDRTKFYQSISLGQSGQLFSPYRTDQLKAWLRTDPMPVAFSHIQLDRQTQHKLILTNRPPANRE